MVTDTPTASARRIRQHATAINKRNKLVEKARDIFDDIAELEELSVGVRENTLTMLARQAHGVTYRFCGPEGETITPMTPRAERKTS